MLTALGREKLVNALLAIGVGVSGTYAAFIPLMIAVSYFPQIFLFVLLAYFGIAIGVSTFLIGKYVDPTDGAFWKGFPLHLRVIRLYNTVNRVVICVCKRIKYLYLDIMAHCKKTCRYYSGTHHATGDKWYYFRVFDKLEFAYRKNVGWIFHWWRNGERIPLIWRIKNEYAWPAPFTNWSQEQALLMNRKPQ